MARKRVSMKKSKDRKVFAHTAVVGKKINVNPRVGRNGFWL